MKLICCWGWARVLGIDNTAVAAETKKRQRGNGGEKEGINTKEILEMEYSDWN